MFLANLIYMYAFWVLLPAVAFCALRSGKRPEQLAASMYMVAAIASILVRTRAAYLHLEVGLFAIDLALLAGLIWLVISTNRLWPMPSAAAQAISCLAHLAKVFEPHSHWLGYQLMEEASGYPIIVLLAVATWTRQSPTKMNAAIISARS